MAFVLSQKYDVNQTSETLKQLVSTACDELKNTLKQYKEEDANDRRILDEFHIPNHLYSELSEVFSMDDMTDVDVAVAIETEKLDELMDKLTISELEKYLKSFEELNNSFQEYNSFIKREVQKYESAYLKETESSNGDLLDLTSLQTNIHELQADIHQANEQQEQKKVVIEKLKECFEIYTKVNERLAEKVALTDSLKDLRHLPANLADAEKRLNELKKKYREICETFSREVTIKV